MVIKIISIKNFGLVEKGYLSILVKVLSQLIYTINCE